MRLEEDGRGATDNGAEADVGVQEGSGDEIKPVEGGRGARPSLSRLFSPILCCHFPLVSSITVSLSSVVSQHLRLLVLRLLSHLAPCLLCLACPWEMRVLLSLKDPLPFSLLVCPLCCSCHPHPCPQPRRDRQVPYLSVCPGRLLWASVGHQLRHGIGKLMASTRTLCPVHSCTSSPTFFNRVVNEKWSPLSLLIPGPLRSLVNDFLHRVRETAGGDRLPSSCPHSTNTASLTALFQLYPQRCWL